MRAVVGSSGVGRCGVPVGLAGAVRARGAGARRQCPFWGDRRIAGELLRLGRWIAMIAPFTVWRIPGDCGIDPAPRRSGPTWKQFPSGQARTVLATDFLHVDTILLTCLYVVVFVEHGTRCVHVAGITADPDGAWSMRRARNLAMALGERLEAMRFLIRKRGGNFTSGFDAVFGGCGMTVLCSPAQAPGADAICERLIGTLRREGLDRVLVVNEAHLRVVLDEYATHDNIAHLHQGVEQRVPDHVHDTPAARVIDLETARIRRRPALGGIASEYHVAA